MQDNENVIESRRTRVRHPEKQNKPSNSILRKPSWIRIRHKVSKAYAETRSIIKNNDLKTVCEAAACPNMSECWTKKHATMMIMGDICTRGCAFCNIATGRPDPLNPFESYQVANAVDKLGLSHIVITSVDRDDLDDGGAHHFASVIKAIRNKSSDTTIEILTPDFRGKEGALNIICKSPPDVFNHNLETVPRLYPNIRPGARYYGSLRLLDDAKKIIPRLFTKSGIMVGLGEKKIEILQVMDDMIAANVDFITIGQYLQPTPKHASVKKYYTPDEFKTLSQIAWGKGFLMVAASPLTRSSYHAGDDFEKLRNRRNKQQA